MAATRPPVALALTAVLAFYAWTVHALLAENVSLLRANTELVQSGNALLRAANARQQEMQTALDRMRPAPVEKSRSQPPRRRLEGCPEGSAGGDSPTLLGARIPRAPGLHEEDVASARDLIPAWV